MDSPQYSSLKELFTRIRASKKAPHLSCVTEFVEVKNFITKFASYVFITLLTIIVICNSSGPLAAFTSGGHEKKLKVTPMFSKILKSRAKFLSKNMSCSDIFLGVSRFIVLSVIIFYCICVSCFVFLKLDRWPLCKGRRATICSKVQISFPVFPLSTATVNGMCR